MESNNKETYTIKGGLNRTLSIDLPLSKSLSARCLVISKMAMCNAPERLSRCDDTQALRLALSDDAPYCIDIGAAGTAMRFATAFLASRNDRTHQITGSPRMLCRPIRPLVDALRALGAEIYYAGEEGFPPLEVHGHELEGGCIEIDGSISSQFISALLMIAPTMKRGLQLTLTGRIASRPYIDMTLSLMRQYGAKANWTDDSQISVAALPYRSTNCCIEADWSAASYWYEAVALARRKDIEVKLCGLQQDSIQGDRRVEELFKRLGVSTRYDSSSQPSAIIRYEGGVEPTLIEASLSDCPDLAQTLIVTAVMLNIPFALCGLESLAIKETDRGKALQTELLKMGARIEIEGNGRIVFKGLTTPLHTACIKTYADHRMALAFAPAALTVGEIEIECPNVISKSYPDYWNHLVRSGAQITEKTL